MSLYLCLVYTRTHVYRYMSLLQLREQLQPPHFLLHSYFVLKIRIFNVIYLTEINRAVFSASSCPSTFNVSTFPSV